MGVKRSHETLHELNWVSSTRSRSVSQHSALVAGCKSPSELGSARSTNATHHGHIHVLCENVAMALLSLFAKQCRQYRSWGCRQCERSSHSHLSRFAHSCSLALALQHADHCPSEAVEVVNREGGHDQCKAVCSAKKASLGQSLRSHAAASGGYDHHTNAKSQSTY